MAGTKIVNGVGMRNPNILIIGEAPGAEEEAQGKPFVGRSGQLVNKILSELGIDRESCYITNVVKFRPENNRTPTEDEINEWAPLLEQELKLINPRIIVCLGAVALKALTRNPSAKITLERGKCHKLYLASKVLTFIPTFHPAYCLRNPHETETLKADFQKALDQSR